MSIRTKQKRRARYYVHQWNSQVVVPVKLGKLRKLHPEQHMDEIFLGNSMLDGVLKSSWRSSRRGTLALRADGKPCTGCGEDFKPWFIKRSEVERERDAEIRKGDNISLDTANVYQTLLDDGELKL